MPYLILTCDFCGKPANGKSTRTIGLCQDHVTRVNNIPKTSGKKSRGVIPITGDGLHLPRLSHKFSGSMNFDNGVGR